MKFLRHQLGVFGPRRGSLEASPASPYEEPREDRGEGGFYSGLGWFWEGFTRVLGGLYTGLTGFERFYSVVWGDFMRS